MKTLGKEKSTPKRGQKAHKAEYGVCGEWLIVATWKWDERNEVHTLVLDDGVKLHLMFVYTWEIEAVMEAMKSSYSYSKHLGERLLCEAIFKSPKPRFWSHGLVRPHVVDRQIVGFEESHADRLSKIKAPWISGIEPKNTEIVKAKPAPQTIRL